MSTRICIVIPTYKRNAQLLQLLDQCITYVNTYTGPNYYVLAVTDSDPENPEAETIRNAGVDYVINPGQGFDDNLYHFYQRDHGCEFIFSISDDDMFYPHTLNPLYMLDAAVAMDMDAVVFNHRIYRPTANGALNILTEPYYKDHLMSGDRSRVMQELLTLIPRHVSMLYKISAITAQLAKIEKFRETLHLYAAPAILAGLNESLVYVDYDLCIFCEAGNEGGAWESWKKVFDGLLHMLHQYKTILPPIYYRMAERGFIDHYLGTHAWLRKMIGDQAPLPTEEQIRADLA